MATKKSAKSEDEPSAAQNVVRSGAIVTAGGRWHVSLGHRLGHAARWVSHEADHVAGAARRAAGVTRRTLGLEVEPLAPIVEELAKLLEAQKGTDYAALERTLRFWSLVKQLDLRGASTAEPKTAKKDAAPAKGSKKRKASAEEAKAKTEDEDAPKAAAESSADAAADESADAPADAGDDDDGAD